MIKNKNGYAALVTCLLLPIVFLSLGMMAFSLLKTRHSGAIKSACQENYHDYFSSVRSQIQFIQSMNPISLMLYSTQQALLPFIWHPAVFKVHQEIYKLRKRLEAFQNRMISSFNTFNRFKSIQVLAQIQKQVYFENRKTAATLPHLSSTSFQVDPKLQIVKRLKITFPPYDPHTQIAQRQEYSIRMKHQLKPMSWMNFFNINKLDELYVCSATLQADSHLNLKISYRI